MNVTLTAKIKILPAKEQVHMLKQTLGAYRTGCNFVSRIVFDTKNLVQTKLHEKTYRILRNQYGLKSQMAQSVMKTVIASYKAVKSNGQEWTLVNFKRSAYDLVWNRDYSLRPGLFSLNTLKGRIKVPFETKGMEQYFDGSWKLGTAKLVCKHKKYFLHIPMTKDMDEASLQDTRQVVGIDMGLNFVAASYDSDGETVFFSGRHIKDRRARCARTRKSLQQKGTLSSRRRLKAIGQKENRWMTDVNHQVSKALTDRYGENTLFVVEDLSGVRKATERIRKKDRYVSVSWSFHQLRSMMEYKAALKRSRVIAVDPAYTSQACPLCGHTEKGNRNKKVHTFCCKSCGYTSNDDRIGAMNLQAKGMKYMAEVAVSA